MVLIQIVGDASTQGLGVVGLRLSSIDYSGKDIRVNLKHPRDSYGQWRCLPARHSRYLFSLIYVSSLTPTSSFFDEMRVCSMSVFPCRFEILALVHAVCH